MMKQKAPKAKIKASLAKKKPPSAVEKPPKKALKPTKKKDKPTAAKLIALPGGQRVHIGYTLGRLLLKLEVTPAMLAASIGVKAWSVRKMLKKKFLHARLLVRISEALQHDVVRYLYLPEHLPGNSALREKMKSLETENELLRKENSYLKKINAFLEKPK